MDEWKDIKIGYAICGSFCTFRRTIDEMRILAQKGADIYPIMSQNAYSLDTRFGKASDLQKLCHRVMTF